MIYKNSVGISLKATDISNPCMRIDEPCRIIKTLTSLSMLWASEPGTKLESSCWSCYVRSTCSCAGCGPLYSSTPTIHTSYHSSGATANSNTQSVKKKTQNESMKQSKAWLEWFMLNNSPNISPVLPGSRARTRSLSSDFYPSPNPQFGEC